MRTLSIRQPWAWLITRPDLTDAAERAAALAADAIKTIENRDWATSYRGPLLIHASQTLTQRDHRALQLDLRREGINLPDYAQLERGGIVGLTQVVDCVSTSGSRWFMGPNGLVLKDSMPLPFVPWKGQLGFFDVPARAVGLAPVV